MNRRMIGGLTGAILLLGLLAVWGAWTARLNQRSHELALQLEAERQRNFMELIGHVESMRGVMGKSLAAGSSSQNMLYMGEVYRRASLATANFMALPLPGPLGISTGKFLNQVGDFSYSVARGEGAGRRMDAAQREELARLYAAASALTTDLQQGGREATNQGFRWVSPAPKLSEAFSGWRPNLLARGGRKPTQSQPSKSLIPAGLERVGPQMDRMPQLVYDGPFSDHLVKRTAAVGGAEITEAEAQRRAAEVVGGAATARVVQVTRREGTPRVFSVRMEKPGPGSAALGDPGTHGGPTGPAAEVGRPATQVGQGGAGLPARAGLLAQLTRSGTRGPVPRRGGAPAKPPQAITIDLTQAGGHLVTLVDGRPAGQATLSLDQAKEIGLAYLQQQGYNNMVPTYGEAVSGFATIQYVYQHNGVIVYPDQIKVRIALDNGEVVGVDGRSYVMAHKDRGSLPAPAVSQAEAAQVLNPALQVQRVRLALIPTEAGDSEVLTYEFLGLLNNETFLVYVNAETGAEERILQMVTTPNGTLAI